MPYYPHFNQNIRLRLLEIAEQLESIKSKESQLLERIEQLINDYKQKPENSMAARENFYKQLSCGLSAYYLKNYYNNKSWWQKLKAFFGFYPRSEKKIIQLKTQLELDHKLHHKAQQNQWKPINVFNRLFNPTGLSHDVTQDPIIYIAERLKGDIKFEDKRFVTHNSLATNIDLLNDIHEFIKRKSKLTTQDISILTSLIHDLEHCNDIIQKGRLHKQVSKNRHINKHVHNHRIHDVCFELLNSINLLSIGKAHLIPYGLSYINVDDDITHKEYLCLLQIIRLDENSFKINYYKPKKKFNDGSTLTSIKNHISNNENKPINSITVSYEQIFDTNIIYELLTSTYNIHPIHRGLEVIEKPFKDLKLKEVKTSSLDPGCSMNSAHDAWLSTRLPLHLHLSLQLFQVDKALVQLKSFMNKNHEQSLSTLRLAGEHKKRLLIQSLKQHREILKEQHSKNEMLLDGLLKPKGKSTKYISNMLAYYDKKIRQKLSKEDIEYIKTSDEIEQTNGLSRAINSVLGLFGQENYKPSIRAQKALLAHKLFQNDRQQDLIEDALSKTPELNFSEASLNKLLSR